MNIQNNNVANVSCLVLILDAILSKIKPSMPDTKKDEIIVSAVAGTNQGDK